MVYAFILAASDPGTGEAHCLLPVFYTTEGNNEHRDERQEWLTTRLCEEVAFQRDCRVGGSEGGTAALAAFVKFDAKSDDVETGTFRVPGGEMFAETKTVVWSHVGNAAYAVVLEADENIPLAFHFLSSFRSVLNEHYKNSNLSADPYEILAKPEDALAMLESFLPNGQMLFLSSTAVKELRKTTQAALTAR